LLTREVGRGALLGKHERDHLEDQGVDGGIVLKWTFMKWDWAWNGSICFRTVKGLQAFVNAVMNVRVP